VSKATKRIVRCVTTPLRKNCFIYSRPVQRRSQAYTACPAMGSLGSFPGEKRPGRGFDHPPPSSVEVKMRRALPLRPLCVHGMLCEQLRIKKKKNWITYFCEDCWNVTTSWLLRSLNFNSIFHVLQIFRLFLVPELFIVVEFFTNIFTRKMRSLNIEINKNTQYNFRTYVHSKLECHFREASVNHSSLFRKEMFRDETVLFLRRFCDKYGELKQPPGRH
jgi:hypothetical protein